MNLGRMLFSKGNSALLDNRKSAVAGRAARWAGGGVEPSTAELLSDPITRLLMEADRLDTSRVQALMHDLRRRRTPPGARIAPRMP